MGKEDLYKRFGPKLFDVTVQLMIAENNILRVHLGLPERTREQILQALENKLGLITDYDWMEESNGV